MLQIGGQLAQVKKLWNHCKFISQFSKILVTIFKNVFKTFDLSLLLLRDSLYLSAIQMQAVTEVIQIERVVKINNGPEQRSFYSFSEQQSDPAKILNADLKALVEADDNYDSKTSIQEYLTEQTNMEALRLKLVDKVFV
jgi:hypothetical protein